MISPFYYKVVLHQDGAVGTVVTPVVTVLPLATQSKQMIVILLDGDAIASGLYVNLGTRWGFVMSYQEICYSVIRGDSLAIYLNKTLDEEAPADSTVFKNGIQQSGLDITHGSAIWGVKTPPAGGGGGGGAVDSVNGQTGDVVVNATNLPGLSTVGKTGQYSDLIDAPTPYSLPTASATLLGGVMIQPSSNVTVDGSGNLNVSAALLNSIAAKFGTATSAGTGTSLINAQTGGVLNLKSVKAGSNVTVTDDGAGTLTVAATAVPLNPATTTGLGGVIIPSASNLTVDVNGNVDIKSSLLTTIAGKLDTAASAGGGTALLYNQTGTTFNLKTVAAGTGMTITDNGSGLLIFTSSAAYTLPTASGSTLGGVKVGTGLAIDGSGVLSVSGSSATITLSGDVTGTGTGTVATTLANSGVTAGTYTKITVDAKGRATVGAQLASGDVTTALGFTPYNGSTNPNGYITTNQAITVSGDATGTGTTAIALTLANSGATAGTYTKVTIDAKGRVTVGANLASGDVTTALGFTPYNGATNPNGYLTANQAVTLSGDATGTGTTAISVVLANSGVSPSTYKSVTVDAKGRVTAGANPTTLAGFGITDALNAFTGGPVGGNITMTGGFTVTNVPTPTNNSDVANKSYVDAQISAVASGTSWKLNAQVATTANIALTGLQTIDGYTTLAGDRVLVKDQTTATQNGVYVAASGAWTRATDVDTSAEIVGMAILVLNGAANQLSQWVNTNMGTIVIGTDNITYTKLAGNGQTYTNGTGLSLTGNVFAIANTGVTAGTYDKVTVNAQGQVTAGSALNSSDITTALGFTPYNATNPSGYISANQAITVSGDVSGSGTTAITLTLPNIATAGTYKSVTVNAKGQVTAGTNPTTLAGFGITDALPAAGGTFTGNITSNGTATVTGLPNPSASSDAATKGYTDTSITTATNNLTWKKMVAAATTANITLSGLQTIDGYSASTNDRILVKNQTNQAENGIYVVAVGAWTRATDSSTVTQIYQQQVAVLNGTQALTLWANTNTGTIVIGTTALTYGQIGGSVASPLTLTGDVTGSGTGTVATTLANSGVTAGTYTKVTVNAKGLVTVGASLSSGDVTTALGFTPYNATNPAGYISANQTITLSGDVSGSGTTAITATLPNVVTAGTYTKVTVDAKGRVTTGAALASLDVTGALGFTPLNKAGDQMTGAFSMANAQNITAAATLAIGAATTNCLLVLGAATITAFDTAPSGTVKTLLWQGASTLTNNATALILPTGANIVTAIGDVAIFMSLGGGNWQCISYMRQSGQSLVGAPDATKLPIAGGTMTGAFNEASPVTLASASTVNIGAAAANTINVSGTTAIVAFDSIAAGAIRRVIFAGILTLTYNATSMILPGAANITTAAGDVAEFISLGSGNWRCLDYTKAASLYVTLSGTETLTNKTLTNPTVTNYTESGVTNAASASYTVDLTQGTDFDVTTNANFTLTLPTVAVGKSFTVTVNYGGTHTLSFAGGTIRWASGAAPTATSVSGKADVYVFKANRAGTAWFGADGGRNF